MGNEKPLGTLVSLVFTLWVKASWWSVKNYTV